MAAQPASTAPPSPTSSTTGSTCLLDELAADLKEETLSADSRPTGVHSEARTAREAPFVDPDGP